MLTVAELRKTFPGERGDRVNAVDGVGFEVAAQEFFTLLGPSGCGKTTTLRAIAGLETPDSGSIQISSRTIYASDRGVSLPPHQRGIGMVFQSYAIWPHMDCFDNVAFPLRAQRNDLTRKQIRERVGTALESVDLAGYQKRPATNLSGGQQQRLALARALVWEPEVLLLDEPLSNLDAQLRAVMRAELKRIQRELGVTTIYVTHDQIEALAMSSRVAVMSDGRIQQVGRPREVYERPTSMLVARFIGVANTLSGRALTSGGVGGMVEAKTSAGTVVGSCTQEVRKGDRVGLSLRPEAFSMAPVEQAPGPSGAVNAFRGTVVNRLFLGDSSEFHVMLSQGIHFIVKAGSQIRHRRGEEVELRIEAARSVIVPLSLDEQDPVDGVVVPAENTMEQ